MAKRSALGRGFGDMAEENESLRDVMASIADEYNGDNMTDAIEFIEISKISPNPFQPRKHFDKTSLEELSQSIKDHGLIQPIVVIKKENGYTLIAGERRLRATKLLGENSIKALLVDLQDKNLRELALIENIQREDLNPIELATSYKELIKEYGITQESLASIVKKSRTQITNTLRLLNLSDKTKELISEGKISQGHAKIVVGLDEKNEKIAIDTIIGQNLNVRQTENLVQNLKGTKSQNAKLVKNLKNLKEEIQKLDLNCKISGQKLIFNFDNEKEIEKLREIFSNSVKIRN